LLAAAFLAVAGYCVVRLVAAHRAPDRYRGCHRALDITHLVMGLGMAVMCSPIGGPVPAAGWQTVFLLIAAWFLGTSWHRWRTGVRAEPIGWHGGSLHHAVGALAMLYMLSGMPDAHHMSLAWMPGMARATGLLGWIFAAYFAGYAVLLFSRIRSVASADVPIPAILLAPRITAGCQLIMALGTGYLMVPLG
jgi:fructose-specific phosphotransferase system IIC component